LARWGGGALAALLAVVVLAGCGEGGGVADGASVNAYVEAPLCAGAQRALAREGADSGSIRVHAVCLADSRDGAGQDLATVGANARRATEDATSIAYLEPPATPSFSRPIVEAAGIPVIRTSSGEAAMEQLLRAIREANSGSLRNSVRESLN
jgi:hypothetical protein